ncbi:hypothetical protein [Sinorhizobium meliloti]|uniref:hypothetical protein n=1 Tax=Rhizobium meliloti TaxID=382 RepID=UPI000FD62113|nr:hypothetical protein [Sinorhizobium meliloti]RVJ73195.1 hypothetical protein CN171_15210 [Sinorhizobium meliloti]
MALLYDARGGIYLWGPLLRKMECLLRNDVFRHRLTGERAECRTVNRASEPVRRRGSCSP